MNDQQKTRYYQAVNTRFVNGQEVMAGAITGDFAADHVAVVEKIKETLNRNPSRQAYLNGKRGWENQGFPMICDKDPKRTILRPWTLWARMVFEHYETKKQITVQSYRFEDGCYGLSVLDLGVFHPHIIEQEYTVQIANVFEAMDRLGFVLK